MRSRTAAALAVLLLAPALSTLGACSSIKEAVKGPELSPVGYPVPTGSARPEDLRPKPGPAAGHRQFPVAHGRADLLQ